MLIIGCDFHTRYQQIAMASEETSGLPVARLILDLLLAKRFSRMWVPTPATLCGMRQKPPAPSQLRVSLRWLEPGG
jgi:hypothetical protein